MLKQRDLKLVHALNGIHRRRHLFLTLFLLATAIILMWLLGLGHNFIPDKYWGPHGGWFCQPILTMLGLHNETIWDITVRYNAVVPNLPFDWLYSVFFDGMFLLPIAVPFSFSLFWFLREFAHAVSEPLMNPPSLSRDASLAIPLGALLCVAAHVTLFYLGILIGAGREYFLPLSYYCYHPFGPGPGEYISPLFLWPICILVAFVALRVFAPWRRGMRKALRGLLWIVPLSLLVMVLAYLPIRTSPRYGLDWPLFSQSMSLFFLCLLSLHWSLGALIALAYRWPRLRDAMTHSCCVRCGYDMRGSFAVGHRECPECGHVNEITPAVGTQA